MNRQNAISFVDIVSSSPFMRSSRMIANVAFVIVSALFIVITKRWESCVTPILPCCVLNWMISRESRLAREGFQFPEVRWQIVFVLPIAVSLGIIAFWFPSYGSRLNAWAIYSIASFSVALLLIKLYERYLSIRKRMSVASDEGRA